MKNDSVAPVQGLLRETLQNTTNISKKKSFAVPINHQKLNSIKLEKRNFSFSMRSKIIQGHYIKHSISIMH